MILNHIPNKDPAFYEAKVGCFNCDDVDVLKIKKGISVENWINEQRPECKNCGCIKTLQPWKEYLAGRAMLSQIVELSKKEEDVETRKFGHIG